MTKPKKSKSFSNNSLCISWISNTLGLESNYDSILFTANAITLKPFLVYESSVVLKSNGRLYFLQSSAIFSGDPFTNE